VPLLKVLESPVGDGADALLNDSHLRAEILVREREKDV
jgi:hypothetical protein